MRLETEPWIYVGILTEKKIKFELFGEFSTNLFNKYLSGKFTAELIDNKIIIKGNSVVIEADDEIFFEPSDPISESFVLRDVVIGVKFHWERQEKQRFNYYLKFIKENDKLTAINHLPVEAYLTSVISSEMNAKCSLNLLCSQAIVARSWLLSQLYKKSITLSQNHKLTSSLSNDELIIWYDQQSHRNFDVCADDHCQRFQGITKVTTNTVEQAINETKGMVLLFNNEICDTRYSKCCGGFSESFENVWAPIKVEYLSPIVDYQFEPDNLNLNLKEENNAIKWIQTNVPAFCNTSNPKILEQILIDYDQETKDFFRWKKEYSQNQIKELIKNKLQMDFGEIFDLIPVERGYSARIVKLKIVGTKKTLIIGKELEIRRVLSETHLYSSAFYVEKKDFLNNIPQKFILHGAGWGHGVGLCQIGAAVMAELGYQFDEILKHYFPMAILKRIY